MRYWKVYGTIYNGECCGNKSYYTEAREDARDVSDISGAWVEEITEEEYFSERSSAEKRREEAKKNPPPPDYGWVDF